MEISMSLPINTPAETLKISPEALEVSNMYLTCQDICQTANNLGISVELVTQHLNKREVKQYIDNVFLNYGFNNKYKIRNLLDGLINKKLEEMQEAEVGSSLDIAELISLSHKVTLDTLNAQIKLETVRQNNTIKNQTNIQLNGDGGSNYQALLDKLINKPKTL